jgi:hypothetical protein
MSDAPTGFPPRFLRTRKPRVCSACRPEPSKSIAPMAPGRSAKLGGRIIYAIEDLMAGADLSIRQSTSDPGRGNVAPANPVNAVSPAYANQPRR